MFFFPLLAILNIRKLQKYTACPKHTKEWRWNSESKSEPIRNYRTSLPQDDEFEDYYFMDGYGSGKYFKFGPSFPQSKNDQFLSACAIRFPMVFRPVISII